MASPSAEESVFEQLKPGPDDSAQIQEQARRIEEKLHAQFERTQKRQAEAIRDNATRPVTISSVQVLGAKNTRRAFLDRIVQPLVSNDAGSDQTLREALGEIGQVVDKLNRLEIFQSPISTFIDAADPADPATTPTDHAVFISAKERGRYTIKTGTEAGSAEGSAYLNVVLRNIFGGAERLNANASLGTRTRSAYSATLDTPILSNPDLKFEIGGLASSTLKSWASHEEVLKGGNSRLVWHTGLRSRHEIMYSGLWRQITSLAEKASPTIRADAGDSFKSSFTHTWVNDTRDMPMLPTSGFLLKTVTEIAGLGPLRGDVAFGKFEVQTQAASAVPIPGVSGDSGVSITAGLRGGLLLPFGSSSSRVNDRFQLGGPTDVRGFRLGGLGPRDGTDAVGGDVYAAGGASLYLPLPRVDKDTPLRLQAFINGGRLLSLNSRRTDPQSSTRNGGIADTVSRAISEISGQLPSAAAGVGLVYAHPAARFEINFSLPLVVRRGEDSRKGLSFGVGLDFM